MISLMICPVLSPMISPMISPVIRGTGKDPRTSTPQRSLPGPPAVYRLVRMCLGRPMVGSVGSMVGSDPSYPIWVTWLSRIMAL